MLNAAERKNIVKELKGGKSNIQEQAKKNAFKEELKRYLEIGSSHISRIKAIDKKMSEAEMEVEINREKNRKAILDINKSISEMEEELEEMRVDSGTIEIIVGRDGIVRNKKDFTEIIAPNNWKEVLEKVRNDKNLNKLNVERGVSISKVIAICCSLDRVFTVEFEDMELNQIFDEILWEKDSMFFI